MDRSLGFWLVQYEFAKTEEEAERLCERGSVRLDGQVVSNVHLVPPTGSALSTLENAYTVRIPAHFPDGSYVNEFVYRD